MFNGFTSLPTPTTARVYVNLLEGNYGQLVLPHMLLYNVHVASTSAGKDAEDPPFQMSHLQCQGENRSRNGPHGDFFKSTIDR